MRLNRTLLIDNKPYPVINERVRLSLAAPGRAAFTIDAKEQPVKRLQMVAFQVGYTQHDKMSRLFFGYVDSVTDIDRRQRVFCREFTAVLEKTLPLSLRHVTLANVLAKVTEITGLQFVTPDKSYANTQVANFYNIGNGYQAMDLISRVFSIPDCIWQQQGHGVIYVGSWDDSRWANRALNVSPQMFDQQTNETGRVAAIPALRPGVVINGLRITDLDFQGNHMELSWKKP